MKCSFCEQPLVCKSCNHAFHAKSPAGHVAVYQPDTIVSCPECQKPLVCKRCGFVYGQDEEEDETTS